MTKQPLILIQRRKQTAMLKRQNQKLRDALKNIHSLVKEGLRTGNHICYWQIEADAAAALNLSDKERGIEPKETHHLYTTIGDEECVLLNLLIDKAHPILDLERAGYFASIMRLIACEFVEEYTGYGFRYLRITDKGREYAQKEWGQ